MDANVTLDVGSNITDLITKLATQVGVTADKVFPWYVKEAQIEGYTFVAMITVCSILFSLMFFIGIMKDKFTGETPYAFASLFGGLGLFVCVTLFSMGLSSAINKIYNPEKAAMSNLIYDLSKFSK